MSRIAALAPPEVDAYTDSSGRAWPTSAAWLPEVAGGQTGRARFFPLLARAAQV